MIFMTVEDTLLVFQIYAFDQNKTRVGVRVRVRLGVMLKHHSKRLTFVQERPGTHASYGALHLTCNVQVEICASDNEVAVSKSEQQWATEDTHALFQI